MGWKWEREEKEGRRVAEGIDDGKVIEGVQKTNGGTLSSD